MPHPLITLHLLSLLLSPPSKAHPEQTPSHTQASLIAETLTVRPGTPFFVGLHLIMQPGWHTYWRDPGDSGLPTTISWTLPEGWTAGDIQWPRPKRIEVTGLISYGYEEEVLLLVPITPPASLPQGTDSVTLKAHVQWLECKEVCLPGQANLSLTLPISQAPPQIDPRHASLFQATRTTLNQYPEGYSKPSDPSAPTPDPPPPSQPVQPVLEIQSLWTALAWAFLGGLILNLMPCVLPVLSLKVLNLLKYAQASRQARLREGLLFVVGVVTTFASLALLLVALRTAGEELGWGFHLQNPWIVATLAVLFALITLNLLGVFSVGTRLISLQNQASETPSLWRPLRSGILVVLVATPCTAPFMGAALGYALTRPPLEMLLVFCALGAGMALPYFLLVLFPAWLRWVPKPGPWMERLKQALALPMAAATLWMTWVLGLQKGVDAMALLLGVLILSSAAAFCVGQRQNTSPPSPAWRIAEILFTITALALLIVVGTMPSPQNLPQTDNQTTTQIAWQPFDPDQLEKLRTEGRTIFVNFTAAWCLTCKVNETLALNVPETIRLFQSNHIVPMKADWTRQDPVITRSLESIGRRSVPAYALYIGKRKPILLPQILTPEIVRTSILKALNTSPSDH
ncbi:MAG: protein-disulfide reductase DsbD family protein [Methylacidiphilales bacterium]|nr:protein-disulfide reductase DsbD family protein [Candidatus Methylacidiphilales bacterium]MDW8349781.1 protein-disulfide reductase DsbD family protein [Verrucomicrobiae bacterium]